jgi:ribulose-phosphate 3-epimerase
MKIGAALLTNNVEELITQVKDANKCDFIQIDVMDGTLTKNQTVWVEGIQKAMKKAKKPVELHLMINSPEDKIDEFIALKPECIIFQYEGAHNHAELVEKIKKAKIKVGIGIAPKTSSVVLRKIIDYIDVVLILGVNPGEQGQAFQMRSVQNVVQIRHYNKKIPIELDGGVSPMIARLTKIVGVTQAVSGSYLQKHNYSDKVLKWYRDA